MRFVFVVCEPRRRTVDIVKCWLRRGMSHSLRGQIPVGVHVSPLSAPPHSKALAGLIDQETLPCTHKSGAFLIIPDVSKPI